MSELPMLPLHRGFLPRFPRYGAIPQCPSKKQCTSPCRRSLAQRFTDDTRTLCQPNEFPEATRKKSKRPPIRWQRGRPVRAYRSKEPGHFEGRHALQRDSPVPFLRRQGNSKAELVRTLKTYVSLGACSLSFSFYPKSSISSSKSTGCLTAPVVQHVQHCVISG